MRKSLLPVAMVAVVALVPTDAFAWGAVGHQQITRRAIELLPPELRPFYEHYRDEVVLRSNDPDLWRNVPWDDDSNHFVDFGIPEFGKPPFAELPREHGAALAKFGAANLKRWGTLPWRVEELAGSLRRAFEGIGRRSPYAISDAILFSAITAHYLQDATQPYHSTIDYDGLQSGNRGIHSRFERDLVEKFGTRLRLAPPPPKPLLNPRDAAFDTLIASHALVDRINAADKAALGSGKTYDDAYYERFFSAVQPVLEQQLSAAISTTASLIIGAWEQAGRPALYTAQPRPVQRARP
jgi:hypothetical protein